MRPVRRALLAILLLHASEVVRRATFKLAAGQRAYVPFAGHEHDWAARELGT